MSNKQIWLFCIAAILCVCAGIGCISAVVIAGRASDDATRAFSLVVLFLVFCLCLCAGGTLWYAGEERWNGKTAESNFVLMDTEHLLVDDSATLSNTDVVVSPPEKTIAVTASTLATSSTQTPS